MSARGERAQGTQGSFFVILACLALWFLNMHRLFPSARSFVPFFLSCERTWIMFERELVVSFAFVRTCLVCLRFFVCRE